ncbi:flagellar hook-associated protein FlgK [Chachezhania antarctica]|uniref:flagellar hook-associated protein FlgK n=1 Tax=Chachezhania antarctica TaxID=2340860 RepID=UPI000EAFFBE3|nr:flagellar hook-associated protein FlgK [Chachezhania antarctica]|tara:strand:+ start:13720 stop:15168 length:1449 start_codon:yes stop_codon:yes gene_type:complete
MSLSTALNNAMTGLAAAGRATANVSENLANSMTPSYGRRTLDLASATYGGGVRVLGSTRNVDPVILSNRRAAEADERNASVISTYSDTMVRLVGSPTDPNALSARLAEFESSLIEAQSRPDSVHRLDAVTVRADWLSQGIREAATGLRAERSRADRMIGLQVDRMNVALRRIAVLNTRITSTEASGGDSNGMRDERQALVDELSNMVPVHEVSRENGHIALFTYGGARLLDGSVSEIEFTVTGETAPHMTIDNGLLSGLTLNGQPLTTSGSSSHIAGGTLAAAFEIRDSLTVDMQTDLDSLARDLVERFETAGLDPTSAPGDPGLFTDDGDPFDALNDLDIASRITINALVDPAQGGDSRLLRDGLGSGAPGDVGYAGQLQAFVDVLSDGRIPPSGRFGTVNLTASGLAASLTSRVSQAADYAGQNLSFASTSRTELERLELAEGVDSDAELQNLIVAEQIFAANARMIATVDELMETLLRI